MKVEANYQSRLRILNSIPTVARMWIEPWGDEIPLAPGKTLEVHAIGPVGDCLALEQTAEHIVVYGWPGSTLKVLDGGVLVRDYAIPSPATPAPTASTP